MRKRLFLAAVAAVVNVAVAMAQQVAVVSNGTTTLYRTLPDAINGAPGGSVIYLPGGSFTISDDVTITKKLTIIGIGHYSKSGNVDGVTTISGNLYFNEGSSGSSVMGCYITNNVYIGYDGNRVDYILVKYCNLSGVLVNNSSCLGTVVNQSYIRNNSYFNGAGGDFVNCVAYGIREMTGGKIKNNILTRTGSGSTGDFAAICRCNSCSINNNVFTNSFESNSSFFSNNIVLYTSYYNISNDEIDLNHFFKGLGLGDIFEKDFGVSPNSVFHFKDEYSQYEGEIGIYADDGFNDAQIAPVPYIVAKRVDEQTDASGKLNIKIRVKAGE